MEKMTRNEHHSDHRNDHPLLPSTCQTQEGESHRFQGIMHRPISACMTSDRAGVCNYARTLTQHNGPRIPQNKAGTRTALPVSLLILGLRGADDGAGAEGGGLEQEARGLGTCRADIRPLLPSRAIDPTPVGAAE